MSSHSPPKLILIYAGYGDTLLLQIQPDRAKGDPKAYTRPRFWLIDGGPVSKRIQTTPKGGKRFKLDPKRTRPEGIQHYNSYYQFLRGALRRHCRSDANSFAIDLLDGIIVTHPHQDHMDGVMQLLADWLPDKGSLATAERPLSFKGPVILNGKFWDEDKPGSPNHGIVLVNTLEAKGFEKKDLADNDTDVPLELKNLVKADEALFKMVPTSPSTRKTRAAVVTIDDSRLNKSSVVNIWEGKGEKPIVTTGDNIGSIILDCLGDKNDLGIFKVPHHGGQRNSLVDNKFLVTEGQSIWDAAEFFFLYTVAWIVALAKDLPNDMEKYRPAFAAFKDHYQGTVFSNWSVPPGDDENDDDNDGDDGDGSVGPSSSGVGKDSLAIFAACMDVVAKSFVNYLNSAKFEYTDENQPQSLRIFKLYNDNDITILNFVDVTPFAQILLDRYNRMQDAVSRGDAETFKALSLSTPLKQFKRKGVGSGGFSTEEFVTLNANRSYLPIHWERKEIVDPISKEKKAVTFPIIEEKYKDLVFALEYRPNEVSLLLKGLLQFYTKVRANNYAISAEGKHGHPSPTTISAIMAAAILRWQPNQPPVRIFTTNSGSLRIEQIRLGVEFLLRGKGIPVTSWNDRVQLLYLEDDYQAEIPLDDSVVEGSRVFRFDSQDDIVEQLKELGEQFKRADAYNLPFSHERLANVFFELSVLDENDESIGLLQLDTSGTTPKLRFVDTTTAPIPPQRIQGIQLQPQGRFPPDIRSPPIPASDLNQTKFQLLFQVSQAPTFETLPGEFVFSVVGRPSEVSGTKFNMIRIGNQVEVLGFDGNTMALSWGPSDTIIPPNARLRFGRMDQKRPRLAAFSSSTFVKSFISTRAFSLQSTPSNKSSLREYLDAIGYQGRVEQVSLAGLAGTIADANFIWGFFSAMPSSICTLISIPTWKVDENRTDITFTYAPLDVDVSKAEIFATVPDTLKEISIAGFSFALTSAKLSLIGALTNNWCPFHVTFTLGLRVVAGKSLDFHLKVGLNERGLVTLDVLAASSMSPTDIFNALKLSLTDGFKLPFGGPTVPIGVKLDYIGFNLEQPCLGTNQLNLQSIYFRITADMWKDASWKKSLPDSLQPQLLSEVSLMVTLFRPQSLKTLSVGLRVDFPLHISKDNADLLLSMSIWPAKTSVADVDRRIGISVIADPKSKLPIPTIDNVMTRLGGQSWNAVTGVFPFLKSISTAISFVQASLEVGASSQGKLEVSAFSVTAQITDFRFLNTPDLVIDEGLLTVDYSKGTGWGGRIDTVILFAGKFKCGVSIVLPTSTVSGSFEFVNLDDKFTLGALVKEIDPSIDLKAVPLIGSDTLASVRLNAVSLRVENLDGKIALFGFSVQIDWHNYAIGMINTFANTLTVSWNKYRFANISSIEGSPSPDSQSEWNVVWEGQISNTWGITAEAQYSKITTEDAKTETRLVFGGSVLNLSGQMQLNELTNTLTRTSPDSESTLWQDSLPKMKSPFVLRRCAINCVIGTPAIFAAGANATWGESGSGEVVLVVQKTIDAKHPWEFMAALSVGNFKFSDLYDNELAISVDKHLSFVRVSILAFYSPGSITLKRMQPYLKNAITSKLLPAKSDFVPLADVNPITSLKFTSGLAIFATLNFQSPPPNSVASGLDVVSNGTLSTTSAPIHVTGYFGSTSDSSRIVLFEGAVESLQLFSSVRLEKLLLRFTSEFKENPKTITNSFLLDGECHIQFGSNESWVLTGSLLVDSAQANLKTQLLSKEVTLQETIGLKISNITFSVDYVYGSGAQVTAIDGAPNTGVVKSGNRSATYKIAFSASVALGSVKANVGFLYSSESPGVLVIDVPVDLNLGILFRELFRDSFPSDLLDISFQKPLVYYAWKSGIKVTAIARGPRSGTYLSGFHAEADVNVFGIAFILSADVINGNLDQKGIRMSATLARPVEVIGVKLLGKDDPTIGPSFSFSTIKQDKGISFACGFALFGTKIPDASLTLTYDPATPGLRGTITIKGSYFPGGSAAITVDLSKRNGKYCLRFANLPSVFKEIIDTVKLIDTIGELSLQDGSLCGAITLAFDKLVKSTVSVDIKLADSQAGLDPGIGSSGVTTLSLSVTGHFALKIGEYTIDEVTFTPLIFTGKIPKSLDDLWSDLADFLKKSASTLIKGLWDDKGKLAEVIALVVLRNISARAIQSLVCRDYYKPPKDPKDPARENQEAEPKDAKDGGGGDGDGTGPGGSGPGGAGSSAGLPFGGTAAFLGWIAAGAGVTLVGYLLELLRTSSSSTDDPPKSIPLPPTTNPGEPKVPSPDDAFAQEIYNALNKDFERWSKETAFDAALKSALDCALDYRTAIGFLRKILKSSSTVKNLGQKMLDDYKKRRTWLVYNFSLLSLRFADKWLDMSQDPVVITFIPTDTGRKLQVEWKKLPQDRHNVVSALTLYIQGKAVKTLELFDIATNTMVMDGPDFDLVNGTQITAKIIAFAALSGKSSDDDPGYAFSSRGKPASGSCTELPPAITTKDATTQPTPPDGLHYYNLTGPNESTMDLKHYPVFQAGLNTYWALTQKYSFAYSILGFNQTGTLIGRWDMEGSRHVYNITYADKVVTFFGEKDSSVSLSVYDLLTPPTVIALNVEIMPKAPSGFMYMHITDPSTAVNVETDYPVLRMGDLTYWALSDVHNEMSMAIIAFDKSKKEVKRWVRSGARYIYKIQITKDLTTAIFYGQSNQAISMTFSELSNVYT